MQTPALIADLRFAPGFERADFRKPRAHFHSDQTLARFSEADHRVERRVPVQALITGGELQNLARLIFRARERAVKTERNRTVGDQLQIVAIDFERGAFLGAARD